MSLTLAVQMDPIERINVRGDSTFALLLEAQQRGHTLAYYTPDRLAMRDGSVHAAVQPLQVRDEVGNHFTLGPAERTDLAACLMRQLAQLPCEFRCHDLVGRYTASVQLFNAPQLIWF